MPRARQHPDRAARRPAPRDAATSPADTASRLPQYVFPFIVLSLVALTVLPAVLQRETRELRNEITDTLDPARFFVTEIQYALARQMAALRAFVITADGRSLDLYLAFLAEEAHARRDLAPLVARLGPGIQRGFADLVRNADAWHGRILGAGILHRREVTPELLEQIAPDQTDYERALAAAARLERAVISATEARRTQIRRTDTFQLWATVALAFVALLAAVGVALINRRLGTLAREAEARRREVERAVEARARFIRGITHDLKTPLGAADGYAQLFESGMGGELTAGQREWIQRLRRSIGQALAIIDDVLLLSRAETGRLEAEPRSVDLADLVREAVEDHQPAARAASIDLRLRPAPPDLPPVLTDPRRVRQILGNLLSNAVKYTPAGGRVRVSLATDPASPQLGGTPAVAIAVSDTGPGIPPDAQERIFEEFARIHTGHARGAGLGLAISQRLARLLGGIISVNSAVGQGSTFTLWLPLHTAAGSFDTAESAPRGTPRAA